MSDTAPILAAGPLYLRTLNPPQREAVLTARLAHLIATRRAWPCEILAVTFTNAAARDVRPSRPQRAGFRISRRS